ncbi:MAG: PSD1 and planctomycete cytochrome C domain-containing protein [Pirellulales bacterium]
MVRWWTAVSVVLGATAASAGEIEFNRDIRPILSDKCFACHGFDAKHRQAELRLDTPAGAHAKAASGEPAIVPGRPDESAVWRRIASNDPAERMPPPDSNKQLTDAERTLLRQWIEQGARYQSHWAFEPLRSSAVPEVPAAVRGASRIDAFIAHALAQRKAQPSPAAPLQVRVRRAAFDLVGRPPSLEELDAVDQDSSPDAYQRYIERLLASPQFGERFSAQWLDVARYGDTSGYLHDMLRTPWPWRDWVIQSFNRDLPYDQFVVEQLAGDLLPNATPEQTLATSFCRNHLITTEGGTLAAEYLNEYAADRVQTLGAAFLGLSLQCCRCHDHKFDPITQEDFYSLQSYFNSIGEKHAENNSAPAIEPLIEIASPLDPLGPKAKVMVMREAEKATETFVLVRGEYDKPDRQKPVARRPPSVLGAAPADAPANRLGLARWLVTQQDSLVARVAVNRYWQRIFGAGLVRTVDDFGVQGEFPSHPELLDELARFFRDGPADSLRGAWSTKAVIRELVLSSTYQQASKVRDELSAVDPDNRLLSYFPRQRLSAEELRDQGLFAAGVLSHRLGGAPVFPYQPDGMWEERANEGSNTKVFKRSEGESLYRRSLYTFWKRTCPPPLMTVFDAPDRTVCVARRAPTNTPLQALAALNDEQFLECARLLAERTLRESPDRDQRLVALFRRAASRSPDAADLETLRRGLDALVARYRESPTDAEKLLRQGASPVASDLDARELAAWMVVASAILNLDESLVRP